MNDMVNAAQLQRVGPQGRFPKVTLKTQSPGGYVLLACEVDYRPEFGYFIESGKKTRLIADLKQIAAALRALPGVGDVVVFKALIAPPGRGAYLAARPNVHRARFDVTMLVQTDSPEAARAVRAGSEFGRAEALARQASHYVEVITASNVRRIDSVDHSRQGVFLFNYFYADDLDQNLAVWEYTAGWFQDQTALDNSTVLLPQEPEATDFTIINHCRWDKLTDIVPSLVFKKSFKDYVLANFEANRTAAMPILYKIA